MIEAIKTFATRALLMIYAVGMIAVFLLAMWFLPSGGESSGHFGMY